MELSELLAYAREKYGIEEHTRSDFPGATVLYHPDTGKLIALCRRQWDSETGELIELADLKCRESCLREFRTSYLRSPFLMRGYHWAGILFTPDTSEQIVRLLFDRAISYGRPNGYTVVLDSTQNSSGETYHDSSLPFSGSSYRPEKVEVPDRILQMRRLTYILGDSTAARNRTFYKQAVFMEDYEETDLPFEGKVEHHFPTYRDLTIPQLRGYFSWRTKIRKGVYTPAPYSLACIYMYELLNGIGTAGTEDQMRKLRVFIDHYSEPESGNNFDFLFHKRDFDDWIVVLGILAGLTPDTISNYTSSSFNKRDNNLITLLHPQAYSDSEILDALIYFSEGRLNKTPVLTEHYDRGLSLFSRLWRIGSETVVNQNQTLFQHCFGEPISQRWYPLLKAVYYTEQQPKDCDYVLNAVHSYHCRSGRWTEEYYYLSPHKHKTFMGLLHQADSLFRRYLHTGRYLKEKEADQWAVPLIEAAIQADREAVMEASRPKVTIDLSGLDQIRKDALTTQNSLLSEADLQEEERVTEEPKHDEETVMEEEPAVPDLPIDAVHLQILRTLLQGKEVQSLIKAHHLMPALIADTINEVFYDEIGDTILLCEDDILSVVEDYREDVEQIIGGSCQ